MLTLKPKCSITEASLFLESILTISVLIKDWWRSPCPVHTQECVTVCHPVILTFVTITTLYGYHSLPYFSIKHPFHQQFSIVTITQILFLPSHHFYCHNYIISIITNTPCLLSSSPISRPIPSHPYIAITTLFPFTQQSLFPP